MACFRILLITEVLVELHNMINMLGLLVLFFNSVFLLCM